MGLSSNKASPLGPSPSLHCTAVGLERRRATPHPCVRVPRGSTVQFPQVATGGRCDSSLVLLEALPFQRWEQPSNFRARRQWHPTPILLPGKSLGRRSLVGCRPWGREESDTTERLHFHFFLSCIGEGHGNPLQCSCLENPRDGGVWWAAVYGVAQSRTRLKRLSSSSTNLSKE